MRHTSIKKDPAQFSLRKWCANKCTTIKGHSKPSAPVSPLGSCNIRCDYSHGVTRSRIVGYESESVLNYLGTTKTDDYCPLTTSWMTMSCFYPWRMPHHVFKPEFLPLHLQATVLVPITAVFDKDCNAPSVPPKCHRKPNAHLFRPRYKLITYFMASVFK